jgi:hypothetical protein
MYSIHFTLKHPQTNHVAHLNVALTFDDLNRLNEIPHDTMESHPLFMFISGYNPDHANHIGNYHIREYATVSVRSVSLASSSSSDVYYNTSIDSIVSRKEEEDGLIPAWDTSSKLALLVLVSMIAYVAFRFVYGSI